MSARICQQEDVEEVEARVAGGVFVDAAYVAPNSIRHLTNFRRLVLRTDRQTIRMIFQRMKVTSDRQIDTDRQTSRMIFNRMKGAGVPPVFKGREKFQPCPIVVGTKIGKRGTRRNIRK